MTSGERMCIRQKWRRWLKAIGGDLGSLLTSHRVFLMIQKAFRENENIRRPALLYRWVTSNYAARVSIRIRRIMDRDKRTISLYRLIQDVSEHTDVITRQYFVSRYVLGSPGEERAECLGLGHSDYDSFAGKNGNQVSVRKSSRDMKRLQRNADRIITFVDKWVAHHEADQRRFSTPTYAHVGKALEDMDGIYCKYALLVTGAGMTTCEPVLQYDWREPLRHPWIEMSKAEKERRLKSGWTVWDKRVGQ